MGFWHTGYIEFHEPVGLDDYHVVPSSIKHICPQCGMSFNSADKLRAHRFESHPLRRPAIFIKGREIGEHPVRITALLRPEEIFVTNCSKIFINNLLISPALFPKALARKKTGDYHLRLANDAVHSEHKLEFRIASSTDLSGIEDEFVKMAQGHHLDLRSVEDFIAATARYRSAVGYCDGICAYLYGVMARERHPDSSLLHEEYEKKFSQSSHGLDVYDRPLARIIVSLIGFHFNHFGETACRAAGARVGRAAKMFESWVSCIDPGEPIVQASETELGRIEKYVTDWDTERIVAWSTQPFDGLAEHTEDLEEFLAGNTSDYDGAKVHMLLAEIYFRIGNSEKSLSHAKALRNMPTMELWAESMIKKNIEGSDDKK